MPEQLGGAQLAAFVGDAGFGAQFVEAVTAVLGQAHHALLVHRVAGGVQLRSICAIHRYWSISAVALIASGAASAAAMMAFSGTPGAAQGEA